ncbi:MAG: helix-turn-helix domain-containing protein [Bacteroidetes bacterium]|nr:helix-turn-helix domain-containing protein [Bacteroidota bacterium]
MDLSALMKKYAEEIGGQYTEYDHSQSIIIVPVSGGRYQTVLGTITQNDLYNRKLISLNSKVCSIKPDIDYKMLLEQTAYFNYCRFVIKDNYLQIEAVASLIGLSEETIKEMVQEVANLADQFELKITGADIH